MFHQIKVEIYCVDIWQWMDMFVEQKGGWHQTTATLANMTESGYRTNPLTKTKTTKWQWQWQWQWQWKWQLQLWLICQKAVRTEQTMQKLRILSIWVVVYIIVVCAILQSVSLPFYVSLSLSRAKQISGVTLLLMWLSMMRCSIIWWPRNLLWTSKNFNG